MLRLTHSARTGTELDCPHPPAMVAAALRQIGWKARPGGRWRLARTLGQPADGRRIALTARALTARGFSVTTALPGCTPARRRPSYPEERNTEVTTRYPTTLPPVPEDRWNAEKTEETTYSDDLTSAVTGFQIDATSPQEAEARTLAWIDHDGEDDLRGATATALDEVRAGRWHVTLATFGQF